MMRIRNCYPITNITRQMKSTRKSLPSSDTINIQSLFKKQGVMDAKCRTTVLSALNTFFGDRLNI